MNKVLKQLGDLRLGDLVEITWLDASRGRLETVEEPREAGAVGAEIDLPVTSYSIYIEAFGKIAKHIVLLASQWLFAQVYGQIDCTIIPGGTVENIRVLLPKLMSAENVRVCQQAFIHGRTIMATNPNRHHKNKLLQNKACCMLVSPPQRTIVRLKNGSVIQAFPNAPKT